MKYNREKERIMKFCFSSIPLLYLHNLHLQHSTRRKSNAAPGESSWPLEPHHIHMTVLCLDCASCDSSIHHIQSSDGPGINLIGRLCAGGGSRFLYLHRLKSPLPPRNAQAPKSEHQHARRLPRVLEISLNWPAVGKSRRAH